jgi:hypothetical protein
MCAVPEVAPQPGSEQDALLALEPGTAFLSEPGFSISTRLMARQPPLGAGTSMDTGMAFGIRDPHNYYLLKVSAIRDVVRLERIVQGRRRDLREERFRARADRWYDVALTVQGDRVIATAGGQPVFEETGVVETAGGIGLWARVTLAGCFAHVDAAPLRLAPSQAE